MPENIAELQPFSSLSLLSVTARVPTGSSGLLSLETAISGASGYQLSLYGFTDIYWLTGSWLLLKVYGKRQQAVFLEFLSFFWLRLIHTFYLPFLLSLFSLPRFFNTQIVLVFIYLFIIIITNLVSRTLVLKVKLEMAANPLINNTTIKLTFVFPTQ